MTDTMPCGCCDEQSDKYPAVYDADLDTLVCEDCADNLRIASAVLRANNIPPIHHGPFCGNSNG